MMWCHFSRQKGVGGLVLHMKQMGLLTSYGMCKLVLWSRDCIYSISMEKWDFKNNFSQPEAARLV